MADHDLFIRLGPVIIIPGLDFRCASKCFGPVEVRPTRASRPEFLSIVIMASYLPCGPIVDERILKLSFPIYKLNAGIVFPDFHPLSQCLHVSWAVFCRIESFNIISVKRRTNYAL